MGFSKSLILVLVFFLTSYSAFSQEVEQGELPDVRRGIYVGMATGWTYFISAKDRELFDDGVMVGVKVGYDVFKYLSAEAQFRFTGHETSIEGSSGVSRGIPTSFNAYQANLVARGGYPFTRRLTGFLDFGGGAWYSNPNFKAEIGQQMRGMVLVGLGLQYFLRVRGLAIGIDPSLSYVQDLDGLMGQASGYIRYTF